MDEDLDTLLDPCTPDQHSGDGANHAPDNPCNGIQDLLADDIDHDHTTMPAPLAPTHHHTGKHPRLSYTHSFAGDALRMRAATTSRPPPTMQTHHSRTSTPLLQPHHAMQGRARNGYQPGDGEGDFIRAEGKGASARATPITNREAWESQVVDEWTSPPWDELEYPNPGRAPEGIKDCTVSYAITPPPRDAKVFEASARSTIRHMIETGFPGHPGMPSFYDPDTGAMQRPIPSLTTRRGRRVVDFLCTTGQQAVFLSRIKSFKVDTSDGVRSSTYMLHFAGAGLCHSRALITMEIRPETDEGLRADTVAQQTYVNMVIGLLAYQPSLELIGMWRKVIKWSDGDQQMEPIMRIVLRRPATVLLSSLPGFANDQGNFDPTIETLPDATVWFSLLFGGRQQYCKTCKTISAVHSRIDCPKEPCRNCRALGHNSTNCPKGGRQPGGRKNKRARIQHE